MAKESSYYADKWYPRVKAARAAAKVAAEPAKRDEAGNAAQSEAEKAAALEAEYAKYASPYDMAVNGGDELFNSWVDSRTEEELRQIIKENRYDTARVTRRWNRERLAEHVKLRTLTRAHQGEIFRNYKD